MLKVMSGALKSASTGCARHSQSLRSAVRPAPASEPGRCLDTIANGSCGSRPKPKKISAEAELSAGWKPADATLAAPAPVIAQQQTSSLLLIDGHGLAFRAYWGIWKSISKKTGPETLLTSDGIPTTVTFGFLRSLQVLLEEEKPDALIVTFDAPQKSFRHGLLPEYKSNRAKAPPSFGADLRNLQQLLKFMRVCTVSAPGYEADDVLAGVARQASTEGYLVRVYSADMDLYQIVDDAAGIAVLRPAATNKPVPRGKSKGRSTTLITESGVTQRLGVKPHQVPDYKALAGDPSDNIAGIPGIGPKTAADLLATYGSVEGIFQQLGQIKKGPAGKLQGRQEDAAMYKNITIIRSEVVEQLQLDLSASTLSGFNREEVEPLLRRLELKTLVKDLPKLQQLMGGAAAADKALTAAVPAAVEKLAEHLTAEQQAGNATGSVAAADTISNISSGSLQYSATGQHDTTKGSGSADVGSAVPAPRASALPAAAKLLPINLQESIPDVQIVTTEHHLQQLIQRLLHHKGITSWLWPQDYDYTPGAAAPLPQHICCMWDEEITADLLIARQTAAAGPGNPNDKDKGADAGLVSEDGNDRSGSSNRIFSNTHQPRRRRRSATLASGSPILQPPAAAVAATQDVQMQQEVCVSPGQQYCTPQLALVSATAELTSDRLLALLQPLLEDVCRPKVMFESKRCHTELRHWGVRLAGVESDVLVAGCLLNPERWKEATMNNKGALDPLHQQHSALPTMAQDMLNTSISALSGALAALYWQQQPCSQEDDITPGKGSPAITWSAAGAVWATHALRGVIDREMRQLDDGGRLLSLLQVVEVPVQRVLSDMEFTGLGMDRDMLLKQKEQAQTAAQELEAQLYELAGERFNIQARQQLSRIMFDKLQLQPRDPKYVIPTTTSGYKATGLEHIEKLENSPFKSTYKEWLYYNTLLTRYYTPSYMDAATPKSGRVHTILHQVGGATGRINSSHPNLQNLPMHDQRAADIRRAFNAPAPGYVLVSADYSQVELRVLAAMSGDQALQEALKGDVHTATARVLLSKGPQDPINPEERQLGKRVNFSIAYGAGGRKLAADVAMFAGDIGFTGKDGKAMLDKFFKAYPGLFDYMTHNQRSGVARGYTQSHLGRRRLFRFQGEGLRRLLGTADLSSLPDMKGLRKLARSEGDAASLRQAGNAPIQGTSADVLKLALLQLHQRLTMDPYNCRLVLTVHDEVVMEVPTQHWPAVTDEITGIMEGVLPLMLKVDVQEGW